MFTTYRGQALSLTDFDKLKQRQGGLLAFNSCFSTNTIREIATAFFKHIHNRDNMMSTLFTIKVDPGVGSAVFAEVQGYACYPDEKEIIFSMNTVFRIDDVRLTLTDCDDPELK